MTKLPILAFAVAAVALGSTAGADDKYTVYREVTILHTNDLHTHLTGSGPERDYSPGSTGDDQTRGGFSRIASIVAAERAAATTSARGSVLFLDDGDFSMGTVFETIAPVVSPDLRLLHAMGCDATTLGNHEFDWGPTGTAYIVNAAGGTGDRVPILASNIQFSADDPGDDALEAMAAAGFIRPWMVKTLPNGIRVGLFGLMGRNAALVVPQAAPVTFRDPIETAAAMVARLEAEHVDLIVCLSHSGLAADPSVSEDEILARYVPGIDVIVSGHTHTLLSAPIEVVHDGGMKTWIVQAGEYGEQVGVLKLRVFNTKPPEVVGHRMVAVDDSIAGDSAIDREIDGYTSLVDAAVRPFETTQVVAETAFPVNRAPAFTEAALGNLVTDAMRATSSALTAPLDGRVVDFAFESSGLYRDPILPGKTGLVQAADAFRVAPLGIGPDKIPGYPLLTFFVTAAEVRMVLEVGATVAPMAGEDFFLQVSGLRFTINSAAGPFQRVTSVEAGDELHGYVPLDISPANTNLYKVATNLFIASFVGQVADMTGGILTIVPKGPDGQPIPSLVSRIVDRNPVTPELEEFKEWQAVVGYLGALPDSDGDVVPNIPMLYAAPTGRIRYVSGFAPACAAGVPSPSEE